MMLLFAICALLQFQQINGECNLLSPVSNSAYKETESKESIEEMCAGDTSSLSKWEQYQCEFSEGRLEWQRCWPQRRMSTCPPGELKGAAFLYHGYSACPAQYNNFAPKLQDECWNVYLITTVGHGYDLCENDPSCTSNTFDLSDLPTTKAGYVDFIKRMVDVIEDEVSIIKECEAQANPGFDPDALEVASGGLSFGAPLAAATTLLSGKDSVITKQVIMSPFMRLGYRGDKNLVYQCIADETKSISDCLAVQLNGYSLPGANLAPLFLGALPFYADLDLSVVTFELLDLIVRNVLMFVTESPENIAAVPQLSVGFEQFYATENSWGGQCWSDIFSERARGGFCNFALKYLYGTHSFDTYVAELALTSYEIDTSIETLSILVERDGPGRNGLAADFLHKFYNYDTDLMNQNSNDCIFRIAAACNGAQNNDCGVPHSNMSPADNLGISPFELWWEDVYHGGLIRWLNNRSGPNKFLVDEWDQSREQCVHVDLAKPDESDLIGSIASVIKIAFSDLTEEQLNTDSVKAEVISSISTVLNIPSDVLTLSGEVTTNEGFAEIAFDDITSDEANDVYFLFNSLHQVAGYEVNHITVNGETLHPN